MLKHKGKKAEAIKHFKAAVDAASGFSDPYWFVGDYALNDGDWVEAEANFRQVVKYSPKDQDAWYLLAQALRGQKKLKEAKKAVQTHLRVNPSDQEARGFLRQL